MYYFKAYVDVDMSFQNFISPFRKFRVERAAKLIVKDFVSWYIYKHF